MSIPVTTSDLVGAAESTDGVDIVEAEHIGVEAVAVAVAVAVKAVDVEAVAVETLLPGGTGGKIDTDSVVLVGHRETGWRAGIETLVGIRLR